MLERMYLRYASAQGFSTHVSERSQGALRSPSHCVSWIHTQPKIQRKPQARARYCMPFYPKEMMALQGV